MLFEIGAQSTSLQNLEYDKFFKLTLIHSFPIFVSPVTLANKMWEGGARDCLFIH